MSTIWAQREFSLPPQPRGFYLITHEVLLQIPELGRVRTGLLHVFIQHTSASLTLNENADPDVRVDMESAFNRIAPENEPYYVHTAEGSDDMPAHIKSVITATSVSIPVLNGSLALGVWQGIFLWEHRYRSSVREVLIHLA